MKKALWWIILGTLSISFAVVAIAGTSRIEKTLLYNDIKITLDSKELKPCDVNGNYIEPFIIDGTTYLPVRGIANSLGLGVAWNGDTNTVALDNGQMDVKSVLYDDNDITISYKGIVNTESGVAIRLFVQNDSLDDISFNITDISADDKILKECSEYLIYGGKKLNILLKLDGIEKAEKTEFLFTVFNMYTQKNICDKMKVTACSEGAEAEKYTVPPFEVTGEVTRETFADFFKSHGKLNDLNGRLSIESTFADPDKGTIQSITIGYSESLNNFLVETVATKKVLDPVLRKMIIVPVTMDFTIGRNTEIYYYKMSIIMNKRLLIKSEGEISASDGSVKGDIQRYYNPGGGKKMVFTGGRGGYTTKIDPEYDKYESRVAMLEIENSVCTELVNTIVTESKKIFDEKAPGLSLEFFGLK